MNYNTKNSSLSQKNFKDNPKRERLRERLAFISLKDVPLKVRRKEAREPLFLTRYE
ncbi:MAG: hypothetical protein ABSE15_06205 [Candidatus Bathyarchaeia archaeon]